MPEEKKEIKRVPARYIGSTPLTLAKGQGTGLGITGRRRASRAISQGDVLLMPGREVLGYTQLRQGDNLFDLGVGRRVKPEHAELDERELGLAGYTFHQGRPDFVALSEEEITQEKERLYPTSKEDEKEVAQ